MAVLIEQDSPAPTRKVAAAGIGGAVSIILVYLIEVIVGGDFQLPTIVTGAITTLISFGAGYIVKEEA